MVENVRRLVEAKGGPGNLPLVYLVFMPMRTNVHEVEAFVELCAALRVDRLVLRPLNPSPGIDLTWQRAGHRYVYQKELLPFDELVRVSGRVAGLCARLGVELSDQMDFGDALRERFAQEFEAGRRSARRGAARLKRTGRDASAASRRGEPQRAATNGPRVSYGGRAHSR